MFNKTKNPKSAVVAVTYRCNSRCRMCGIWHKTSFNEISAEMYLKLPSSLDDINITGGEPFLRSDLTAIIDAIFKASNPAKLVISSNGFLTEIIIKTAAEIMRKPYADKVNIAISMDAVGEKHDEIRGVPGAYRMVLKTIRGLRNIGFENIGIGYTFIEGNEKKFVEVYKFAKENKLNFGATIAHNSNNYFSIDSNDKLDEQVISDSVENYVKGNIQSLKKNELGKCYYMHGLRQYAKSGKRIVPCDAATGSFFIDPSGDIYPCNILSKKLGNITENSFSGIWEGEAAVLARDIAKNCPSPCWMVCTAKPGIKKNWVKAGLWILKEKIRNYVKY